MKTIVITVTSLLASIFCSFSRSVNQDNIPGLSAHGDGLSCDNIYLTVNSQEVKSTVFVYGETFYITLKDIRGFKIYNGKVFIGMKMVIYNKNGGTVTSTNDMLYNNTGDLYVDPLILDPFVMIGEPMYSNNEYTVILDIWDKKGEGKFRVQVDFRVISNHHIAIESNGITYSEIFLFSLDRNTTIVNNVAYYGETIYLIINGIDGFVSKRGLVFPGLSFKAIDANGDIIVNVADLFGDSSYSMKELKTQLYSDFSFDENIKSPVKCEIFIWDKKGENKISCKFPLKLVR